MPDILNVNLLLARGATTSVLTLSYTIRFNATEQPSTCLLTAHLVGVDQNSLNTWIPAPLATFVENETIRFTTSLTGVQQKQHVITVANRDLNEDISSRDELQAQIRLVPTAGSLEIDSVVRTANF